MSRALLVYFASLLLASCGSSQAAPKAEPSEAAPAEPEPTAGEPTSSSSSDPESSPETGDSAPESGSPSGAGASEASAEPDPIAACRKACEGLANKCPKSSVQSCTLSCGRYDPLPKGCESEAKAALMCLAKAEDLPCANVAPESCAKPFRQLQRCKQGAPATDDTDTKSAAGIPAGWQTFDGPNFRAALPATPTERTEGDRRVWSATDGNGVTYEVHATRAPAGKPTEKSLLRWVTAFLGPCAPKLKLHGMIESDDGSVVIRMDTRCKDGLEWHGAVHVVGGELFVVTVKAPAGRTAQTAALLENFQVKR